jgi:hypothetical protein
MSLVVLGLAGSAACHRSSGVNSKAAVQQAIEEHVKQRPNLASSNMTVEIGDVAFNGDTAQAQVKFRSKQMPNVVVGVNYKLRRVDNGWQVESSSVAGMPGTSPHGDTAGPMPAPSTNPTAPSPQPSH